MINLLTTRIKDAKSELTALKTAYVIFQNGGYF